jgi:hypothetical protein
VVTVHYRTKEPTNPFKLFLFLSSPIVIYEEDLAGISESKKTGPRRPLPEFVSLEPLQVMSKAKVPKYNMRAT